MNDECENVNILDIVKYISPLSLFLSVKELENLNLKEEIIRGVKIA